MDLFPDFATRRLAGAGAEVFARVGGAGPPVLLLHGYPQTHACWHAVAARLKERATVIAADLRGYGASGTPGPLPDSAEFSKRAMAEDLIAAMNELGFDRFIVAGHDRGARVAYRMALDHPYRVAALVALNILPTFAMWERLQENAYAMRTFLWLLLAQPSPLPERLIAAAGLSHLHAILRGWAGTNDLTVFDPYALAAYESAHTSDDTIAASCGDYRAGWTTDRVHDQADLDSGHRIRCPTFLLWSHAEFSDAAAVLAEWRRITTSVSGRALPCGHFSPEEAPDDVARIVSAILDHSVHLSLKETPVT